MYKVYNIFGLAATWPYISRVILSWLVSYLFNFFKLADDFKGFSTDNFCVSPRYDKYLDCVFIPNGMIKDR